MKTTKMVARIAGLVLAGMMVMGLASCGGKADKVEGTYVHDDCSLVLNANGTGFFYQKTEDGFEWRRLERREKTSREFYQRKMDSR